VEVINSVFRGNVYSVPVYLYLPGNRITEPLITKFDMSEKWSGCRVSMGNQTVIVDSRFIDHLPARSDRALL
jgi:hypothetical protein